MNLKKILIASLTIGAMLSITACGTSTEKDQANQSETEQTNAQEETKTTSAEQTNTSKNEEKATSKEQSANEKNEATSTNVSMKNGVTEVVQLIDEVEKQLKASPKQETLNKLGKQLAEKWDVVEKEVEAKHPSDYKTIELNLYPLIAEMGKQQQDLKKLKTLTTKTKQDLNQFLNKL